MNLWFIEREAAEVAAVHFKEVHQGEMSHRDLLVVIDPERRGDLRCYCY